MIITLHNLKILLSLLLLSHPIIEKFYQSTILPTPLHLTRFSPSLFVVLQEIFYQPCFALIFCFSFLFGFSSNMWHNKRIHGHGFKIRNCCCFLETKFEVDTASIIFSCLCHFRKVNKELFRYY